MTPLILGTETGAYVLTLIEILRTKKVSNSCFDTSDSSCVMQFAEKLNKAHTVLLV